MVPCQLALVLWEQIFPSDASELEETDHPSPSVPGSSGTTRPSALKIDQYFQQQQPEQKAAEIQY